MNKGSNYLTLFIVGFVCLMCGYLMSCFLTYMNKPQYTINEPYSSSYSDFENYRKNRNQVYVSDTTVKVTVTEKKDSDNVVDNSTIVKNETIVNKNKVNRVKTEKPVVKKHKVEIKSLEDENEVPTYNNIDIVAEISEEDNVVNVDTTMITVKEKIDAIMDFVEDLCLNGNHTDNELEIASNDDIDNEISDYESDINQSVKIDSLSGAYIFNEKNGTYEMLVPLESVKCKIKNNDNERFIKRQIAKMKFNDTTSYTNVDSTKHIILCFDNNSMNEMFNNVENISNINIHRLTQKKNCREMYSDVSYYGDIASSNSSVTFDVKVIDTNVVELVLPSNIASGEYAISYDNFKTKTGRNTTHTIFDFTVV